MRRPTTVRRGLLVLLTVIALVACDAFLGPLNEPLANGLPGDEDALPGDAWQATRLLAPAPDASVTSDTVVSWPPLASPAADDQATNYALHVGTADADGTYRIEYFVPYLEATEFDLARLPLTGGTEYYVAVIGRLHYEWDLDEVTGIVSDYTSLDTTEFDVSDGVFSAELVAQEGSYVYTTYVSETYETFPTRFTYDGPGLAFAAAPTGASVNEGAWGTNGTVTVSWTDPASASLDSIRVTQFPGPDTPFAVAAGDESITLSSLSPYLAYVVWVQAVADDGTVSEPAIVSFSPGASLGDTTDLSHYDLYVPETLIPGPGFYEPALGIDGYTASPRWIVTKYADGATIGAGVFEAR